MASTPFSICGDRKRDSVGSGGGKCESHHLIAGRRTARTALTILGTAGTPDRDVLTDALQQVMHYAAKGELQVDTTSVLLAEIASAWEYNQSGRRIVVVP